MMKQEVKNNMNSFESGHVTYMWYFQTNGETNLVKDNMNCFKSEHIT
jgi:hypothetical protein